MTSVLARLHDGFLAEYLDDDLDAILGAAAGPVGIAGSRRRRASRRRSLRHRVGLARRRDEVPREAEPQVFDRAEHLHRMLGQLVTIARQRAGRAPGPELDEAIRRADHLRARPVTEETVDQACLRRLALAASELMDLLAIEVDDSLPTFESAEPHQGVRTQRT
ncbi:hypothetical protein ABT112_28730 [Streptomyces sp. NPDC002055]|uniref:hypothetical protein n=1 Tax=Streptomyces sp. NPDC002055 TaxID=3154534 RepID=UPI003331CDD3